MSSLQKNIEYKIREDLNFDNCREIDGCFIVSSAKPGNGVEQIRDNNIETFWQSDGIYPHVVNIQVKYLYF